ncbi:MAG: protein kinase, partial [Phycisphaerae bacterium]
PMATSGVGDRISEYVLDAVVGTGSFGQVWKAHHHIWTDQLVAIKIPTDSQYVRNLQREGITIHGLNHPNIVRAIGLDPYAETPYLVMEFIDGVSLRELIDAHPKGLPIRAAHRIVCGLLRALGYSHEHSVIHRDIKPANILIAGGRDKPADDVEIADVKVTDFGLGRAGQITTSSIMQSGSLLSEDGKSISGTLAYMAPEQRDGGQTDALSDLYAVGIVLFETMVGERPSGSDRPSQVRDGLPSWVDPVFSRLYTRRERRFTSAADVLQAIDTMSVPPRFSDPSAAPPPVLQKTAARTCPTCQQPIGTGDNYCIHCGARVVSDPRRCECGAYPEADDRYCIQCGATLLTDAR